MPVLQRNAKVVEAALQRSPMVYRIEGVEALHLAVLGKGRGSWRLRYTLYKGGQRQWHTIGKTKDLSLGTAIETARSLISKLQLEGAAPRTSGRVALPPAASTVSAIYELWLDHPGRKHALRDRTRTEYERIFSKHVKPHIGSKDLATVTRTDISLAVEKVRLATTDASRGFRGAHGPCQTRASPGSPSSVRSPAAKTSPVVARDRDMTKPAITGHLRSHNTNGDVRALSFANTGMGSPGDGYANAQDQLVPLWVWVHCWLVGIGAIRSSGEWGLSNPTRRRQPQRLSPAFCHPFRS
jgi:Phage integrase, N-terminal SAM-like domain